MDRVEAEDLIVRGTQRAVAWARDPTGRRWAKDFLEQEARPSDRARIRNWCHILADAGQITNPRVFRKEAGPIWAFKSGQVRIGAFLTGRTWYLTHGFMKKKPKWDRRELHRAERIRVEQLLRLENSR